MSLDECLDECPACGAQPNDWRDSPQVNIAALAARLRMAEEALRHVRWRNHPHSAGCDACLAAEILAWPPETLSDPKGTP